MNRSNFTDNPLNYVDTLEILRRIEKFREANIKKMTDIELSNLLLSTVTSALLSTVNFSSETYLFKIRKHSEGNLLMKESDLWAPPKEYCSMGRLNMQSQSMLYTALDGISPAYEMKLAEGEYFTLMQYKIKKDQIIQATRIALHDSETDQAYGKLKLSEKGLINAKIINHFLVNEFTRDVGIGTEFLYRISNRLALDYFDLPNCDGYLYPSVARKEGYNLALKPESAKRTLEFNCLFYARLKAYEEDKVIYEFIKKANKINEKGDIIYEEDF